MTGLLKRWRLELEDWLRYNRHVRRWFCRYKAWRVRSPDFSDPQAAARAISQLCAAARLAYDVETERKLQTRIVELVKKLDAGRLDWTEFTANFKKPLIGKAALLKPYLGPSEKGVLFISFETEWIRLLAIPNYRELAERYTLVISPTSSWGHALINYVFPAVFPGPIFTLISNIRDLDMLPRQSENHIVVPLYASSWVNPNLYQPLPRQERTIDLLMVANWAKYKRHQALFSALRHMPKDLRVTIHGQDQDGRTAQTMREMAGWYGVADRITISSNKPYAEVPKLFCQAKATVMLSKYEGSCVVIAESMFADAPAALLQDAEIGSRAFINEKTGRFVDGSHLARDLTEFVRQADRYEPRSWAVENISCFRSSQILNDLLKEHALKNGQAWTQDIAAMHWAPDPRVVNKEDYDRLLPEKEEIQKRFGMEIGVPWK